jgi:hypothetical protein
MLEYMKVGLCFLSVRYGVSSDGDGVCLRSGQHAWSFVPNVGLETLVCHLPSAWVVLCEV